QHAGAGPRFSSAHLLPGPGDELSQARHVAAGRWCERIRLRGGLSHDRFALACLHRRRGRRPRRRAVCAQSFQGEEAVSTIFWITLAGAVLTYLTRIGGHLVLSRFERIHPRVEAGLAAVPAAVLTTLVAPAAMEGGPAEVTALVPGVLIALAGGGMMPLFLSSAAVLILLRNIL